MKKRKLFAIAGSLVVAGSLVFAGVAASTAFQIFRALPGDSVQVAGAPITCAVVRQSGKNIVTCFKRNKVGLPLPRTFAISVASDRVFVVKLGTRGNNLTGKIVFNRKNAS
jgi:hypothetical protein